MKAGLRRSSRLGRQASTRQGPADMAMAQRLAADSYASEMLHKKEYNYRRTERSTRLAIIGVWCVPRPKQTYEIEG
jgi:hypothetical protein